MFVQQLSVFLENRSGRLAAATGALAAENVNILALSLADTVDFGILRLIVSDPAAAARALKGAGFTVIANEVIAVAVEDRSGALDAILQVLSHDDIDVEYMYGFSAARTGQAALVFRFADNAAAVKSLMQAGVNVLRKVDVLG